MRLSDFGQQIGEFQAYISSLQNQSGNSANENTEKSAEIFVALSAAAEELRVAGEELFEQNKELASAREQAAKEEARYRALFEFAPDGYIVTDMQGIIIEANRVAVQMLRQPYPYLIGKPLSGYIDHHVIRDFMKIISGMSEQQSLREWETRFTPIQGMLVDVSIDAMTENDLLGEPVRIRWMIRDITEQKRMQKLLFDTEVRLRTIFDATNVGILLLDLKGSILESNPAIRKLFGYTVVELNGVTLFDLVHSGDRRSTRSINQHLASGRIEHSAGEVRVVCKDKDVVWIRLNLSLVRDQARNPKYVIALLENITTQKAMETELVEVERRMVDISEAERVHLARELHDGPLQDLYGVMYQMKIITDTLGENSVSTDLARVRDMVQRVIDLLRSITGDLRPPTLTFFGITKAIQSHTETLTEIYPGLKIHLELDDDQQSLNERVRYAYFRIYQHCMANIIRHAGAAGVNIRFSLSSNRVVLEIEDDGIGFVVPYKWIEFVGQGHFGLIGAAERALTVGAEMKIRSSPGNGTLVRVSGPRKEDAQTPKLRFSLLISDQSPRIEQP